jgi:membrane-associated HD superfamily phosphohydrolase
MESNLIQDRLNKAEEAMKDAKKALDKAQVEYEEAKEKYKEAEAAFTEDWKKNNPTGSKADLLDYLEIKLKVYSSAVERHFAAVESSKEIYKKLLEMYEKTMEKMTIPPSDQLLKVMDRIELEQVTLANYLIPFIEELKLQHLRRKATIKL